MRTILLLTTKETFSEQNDSVILASLVFNSKLPYLAHLELSLYG